MFLLPGRSVEELPRVLSIALQSYRLLYSALTKDLSDKIATQEHMGGKRTKKKASSSRTKHQTTSARTNPFAVFLESEKEEVEGDE